MYELKVCIFVLSVHMRHFLMCLVSVCRACINDICDLYVYVCTVCSSISIYVNIDCGFTLLCQLHSQRHSVCVRMLHLAQ